MYLCEVAIVSQLCISIPYVLHGLCEDYLTCDIAFNAVMPLSRASTRGRYSRIEGVTRTYGQGLECLLAHTYGEGSCTWLGRNGETASSSCSWGGNGMRGRVHWEATRLGRNGMRGRVHREGLDRRGDGNEAWHTAQWWKRTSYGPNR